MLKGEQLKEYISACDCEEIQKGWKPQKGDYWRWNCELCRKPNNSNLEDEKMVDLVLFEDTGWDIADGGECPCGCSDFKKPYSILWLPTLEQLWEIAGKVMGDDDWYMNQWRFYCWSKTPDREFPTRHLALVEWIKSMREKK